MRALRGFVLLWLLSVCPPGWSEQTLWVIVNTDNPVAEVSRVALIDLFMGKYVAFPDGEPAAPLDLDSPWREAFYRGLTGRPISQINAYWARLRFTGRVSPPEQLDKPEQVIQRVGQQRDAIGYVPAMDLPGNVKVVFEIVQQN